MNRREFNRLALSAAGELVLPALDACASLPIPNGMSI
jgi:hypothetical protein